MQEIAGEFVSSIYQTMKKDDNGKLWVEVIIVSCLKAVASVDVFTVSNTDVKLSETRTVRFSRLKSPSRFERTNKLDHDYSS